MLLWSRRSRAVLLGDLRHRGVRRLRRTAGHRGVRRTGRLVDGRVAVRTGLRPLRRGAVRGEPGQPLGQPADRVRLRRHRVGARHVGGARRARSSWLAEPRHRRGLPPTDRGAVGGDRPRPSHRVQLPTAAARRHPLDRDPGARRAGAGLLVQCGVRRAGPARPGVPPGRGIAWGRTGPRAGADHAAAACCPHSARPRGWRSRCRWASSAPR